MVDEAIELASKKFLESSSYHDHWSSTIISYEIKIIPVRMNVGKRECV